MAHIDLPEGLPGIRGPMAFRPETAKPMNELVNVLLHEAHSLSPGERELIATYVSARNDCRYCQTIHGAIAAMFCMCNRYVDGLATWAPDDPDFYRNRAAMVVENGYGSSTLAATAAYPGAAAHSR